VDVRPEARVSRPALVRAAVGIAALGAACVLALGATRAFADDFDDELEPWPVVRQAWSVADVRRLQVRFPVGSLEVVGTDGDSVIVQLEPECHVGSWQDCEKVSRRIGVRSRARRGTLELSIVGKRWFDTSRVQIRGRLEVPRSLALELEMKVGELEVTGVGSNAEFRLDVGEATVRRPEKGLQSARVAVWIGEAMLVQGGRSRDHSGVFGSGLHWRDGSGTAALALRVGIGEASVYLD
jgi:hypothetical protein